MTALSLAASPTLLELLPLSAMIPMLINEVQRNDEKEMAILHRRVTFLIDEWFRCSTFAKLCSPSQTSSIFQMLVVLLKHRDLCVRVFAAISLRGCIEQYEFDFRLLVPFVSDLISSISALVFQLQHDTIHVHLLSVLSQIVANLNTLVLPFVFPIVDCLERLWRESGDNFLLKSNVVQCLTVIASIPCLRSDRLTAVLTAVVAQCVDIAIPDTTHYLEEGIALWVELLSCTDRMDAQLLRCWQHVPAIVQDSSEFIAPLARITASYLALDRAAFHASYGMSPIKLCNRILNDIDAKAIRLLLVIPHAYIQLADNPQALQTVYPFLQRLLCLSPEQVGERAAEKLTRDVEIVIARLLLRHSSAGLAAFFATVDVHRGRSLVLVGHWLAHLQSPATEEADRLLLWLALCRCIDSDYIVGALSSNPADYYSKLLQALLTVAPELDDMQADEGEQDKLHELLFKPLYTTDRKAFIRARLRSLLHDGRLSLEQLQRCCPQSMRGTLEHLLQTRD